MQSKQQTNKQNCVCVLSRFYLLSCLAEEALMYAEQRTNKQKTLCVCFVQVLFAFIPPPSIRGGWLTFGVALLWIGILTAIISDLASIFGCIVGLSDTITGKFSGVRYATTGTFTVVKYHQG